MKTKKPNQNGFTPRNTRRWRAGNADSRGFIPLMIAIVIILVAIIWLVYTRVAHSHN